MNHGNLFQNLPADLSAEVFEVLAQSESVTIERIVSKGHTSPESGWYDQERNEWVIVLQGRAKLEFEAGGVLEIEAGTYVNIPAHARHRVIETSVEPVTIWLAVHY